MTTLTQRIIQLVTPLANDQVSAQNADGFELTAVFQDKSDGLFYGVFTRRDEVIQ